MLSISDNPVSATACGLHLHLELPCLKMYIHKLALAEHDPQKAKVCVCLCVYPRWVHESCCAARVGEDGSLWSETKGKESVTPSLRG